MDRICNAVLDKVNALATLGRYVIISDEEFYESFPDDEQKRDELLTRALKYLQSEGYIDLRYSRQNMYCVAPLKKYEAPPEPLPPQTTEIIYRPGFWAPFIAAFCGGAAGSLLISLLFALI